MARIREVVEEFLSQKHIAVVGVSRSGKGAANSIYARLKDTGHDVVAVNPRAGEIGGEPCYPDLESIPGKIDGVVAVTTPENTENLARQCVLLGVPRIWMHRSPMGDSVSQQATALCEKHGMGVIAGGCPMMFQEPVDLGHKCMRWWCRRTGALPAHATLPDTSSGTETAPRSEPS